MTITEKPIPKLMIRTKKGKFIEMDDYLYGDGLEKDDEILHIAYLFKSEEDIKKYYGLKPTANLYLKKCTIENGVIKEET